MVITDSFHNDIDGKDYKYGSPNKVDDKSTPVILFYFVDDYERVWDEGNPISYDDEKLKNNASVSMIDYTDKVLLINLFNYESFEETLLKFEVGKETSIPDVVDENDHTKEYKITPTKIVVANGLDKDTDVFDEIVSSVWQGYYSKAGKDDEKLPKVAENVQNAESHSHKNYKKCAECSDSVFELEEEICFECSSFGAETFEANAKTGNKVYIITRRSEDYSAYRELDVAGFGSKTEARKQFNLLFKESKEQDYPDETVWEAKDYMSWGEDWGVMSYNNNGIIYELREVIVGDKGDFYFDAESGLVDINYDAKIRLNNPKDAKYITPSIEEGMAFENGEGVLSSKSKIDMNAESRFDKLSNEIADEYEEKGMSPEKAQEVGDATAAMIGRKKYGKQGMAQMSKKGMNAEGDSATYSPSDEPDMVNEIQTSPTNESPQLFNASNTFNTTTALGIGGLVVAALSLPMLYSSAKSRLGKSAEEKRKSSGSVRKNHTQVKNSEYSVGQVNPVEAEGQQDIHGAEGITNPRHSPSPTPSGYPSKNLKMW